MLLPIFVRIVDVVRTFLSYKPGITDNKLQVQVKHIKRIIDNSAIKRTKTYRYVHLSGSSELVDEFLSQLSAELNRYPCQSEKRFKHILINKPIKKREAVISLGVEYSHPPVSRVHAGPSIQPHVCLYSAFIVVLCRFRDRANIVWDIE